MEEKLAPIVVIIDEFADLADQLESKKEQNAFYKPVQRIAQAGRSRGIHLVMLVPTASKKARTQYSVYAVEYRHRLIPLNLALANRVIDNQIRSRRFAFLGKRGDVLREHFADGYKADLYIENTKTILEIKSILALCGLWNHAIIS